MARKKPTRKGYKKITESTFRPEVTAYGELLLNAGRDEREVARGMLYAEEFGMEAPFAGAQLGRLYLN